jgi:hypothetical protein
VATWCSYSSRMDRRKTRCFHNERCSRVKIILSCYL